MGKLLLRLFVKNPDTPDGRAKVGSLAGTVGIVCNLLLFLGKLLVMLAEEGEDKAFAWIRQYRKEHKDY